VSSQFFRFDARGGDLRRSALLERLLARADDCVSIRDWPAAAFRVIAPQTPAMPAVAAAALYADRGAVDAAWVCAATPVHYVAEMTSVRLPHDGMLSLDPGAAQILASDFNRVWQGSGIQLTAARSGALFCLFDRTLEVTASDPQESLGRHIEEYLPSGADSASLRQLISETEMWLFEHRVNRTRSELGAPIINGLWFWGGGAPLASLPAVQGWAEGNDLFFNSFGAPREGTGESGVMVAGVPGRDEWLGAESRWLKPAAEKLRSRRIARLLISAGDRIFTVTPRGMRRFWRTAKPWWESFA
jgi:hypothetical protein